MWSWWPCVSTTASRSSNRSRTYSKSGRTRSTPGISACGKDRPTSTISMRPPLPLLPPPPPPPPRKTTRADGSDEAGIDQRLPDPLALLGGGRHERQPRRPDRMADHLQRGLPPERGRGGGTRGG